ncbi:MAG: PAS domain S-box protein [Methanococcoides sp.]|nr:PAS domain S-box protein [Methanococcoides sp.]
MNLKRMDTSNNVEELLVLNLNLKKELEAQKEQVKYLQKILGLQEFITDFSIKLIDCDMKKFDDIVNLGLSLLGNLMEVDRSYVFLCSKDGAKVDNTHEWCAIDIEPQIKKLKDIDLEKEIPWQTEQIRKFKTFHVTSIEELPPEAHLEKKKCIDQGIQSLVVVPLSCTESLIGFIGFDSVKKKRSWDKYEIETLTLIGQVITGTLLRLRAEEELRTMEQYFRAAFENSGVAIIIADAPDGNIQYINDSVWDFRGKTNARLTGITIEEYICSWKEFYPDGRQYKGEEMPLARSIISGEVVVGEEVIVRLDDGSERWALANSAPIKDENDEIYAAIVAFVDVTERKKAEVIMLEAKTIAEDINIEKSKFLANMSHELRTPLNAVIGFSEMLASKNFGELNEKQERYVNNISSSGSHLLNLINDILDLSKIEAGKMNFHYKYFKAKSTFNEIESILASISLKKQIHIITNIAPEIDEICADPNKFRQIIYNLLSNALKFTPENGNITINASLNVDMIKISVTDTGIGISEEDQKRLFKPFVQIDSSSSREFQGTGLGLSLVKKFIQMHKGTIWLESEVGKGTTFYFEIPVNPEI